MTPILRGGVLAIATMFYAWVLTRREFDLFGAEQFGLTFNSMLDHMLQGRWDVDPATIGYEAFNHDGRAYAYFGPFPAFLRLPLLILPDWRTVHVERLSCLLAIMIGITAQTSATLSALAWAPPPIAKRFAPPLVIACAFSGAPMLLGPKGALIYHEVILWAWALAMLFIMLALPALQRRHPAGWRRLCALAACAGLCLLTRSSTGVGLYLACGLLLLNAVVGHRSPGAWRRVWAPSCVLAVFLVLTGMVNQGRWGNPLVFANLRLQTILAEDAPERLLRLERHGLFDWHRLDLGLLYYVFPVWTPQLERALPIESRLDELFDGIERPASSLLLTDPAWCFLSALGVIAIARRRARLGETLVAIALALPPTMMVIAWYLAFRYRIEFAPLLVLLSLIGLRDRAPTLGQRSLGPAALIVSGLCLGQVLGATIAGRSYAERFFGPAPGYTALSLSCTLRPVSCPDTPPALPGHAALPGGTTRTPIDR